MSIPDAIIAKVGVEEIAIHVVVLTLKREFRLTP
jgi:hypothetical protein